MLRQVFDIRVPWINAIPAVRVRCLLCGERDLTPLNTFLLNGHRFYTVRCRRDGMMWLDPQPTDAFYERLYSERYHQTGDDDPLLEQATLDVHSDEALRSEVAKLRLDELEPFASGGRFLEVGFGNVHTLLEARSRGWDVHGVELSPVCVEDALSRGIPASCAALPKFHAPQGSFDVVAMYSVIEHTPDPEAYLSRARELLRPGGTLVLRLPDTGDEGPPASLIAHRYHFNLATISTLLRRCRFELLWTGARTLWKPRRYPGSLWNMTVISRRAETDWDSTFC